MTSPTPALARLVPDADRFRTDTFGREPVHARGLDPGGFRDLLSLEDVDHVVAATAVRAPAFRLVKDGVTLPMRTVTRQARIGSRPVDDLVDVAAVHRQLADGATVVLQGLHRSWAPVARFCRALEAELTHPVQANAYLTPPVAQGLHLHGDPHDVFAVQTYGVKRWVVHPPAGGQPWDIELQPGDVLYLPAGVRHAAQTIDRPSLHLTLGVRTTTWADVLRHRVDAALERATWSQSLPAGWADDPGGLEDAAGQRLRALIDELSGDPDLDAHLAAAAERFHTGRQPELEGGIRDLLEIDHLDDTTGLRRRQGTRLRLASDGDRVRIVLRDRTLHAPGRLEPVLAHIAELEAFAPKELDHLIDEPSRLVLCRRLVREGLLTVDRGPSSLQ